MSAAASPSWVDFHCHLDLYRDHQSLIRECDAEKIATLGVTTTPKAFARNTEMAAGYPYTLVGLGLHPQLVAERSDELPLFEKLLPKTKYVGEIGLDAGSRFYASFDEQRRVFARILRACDEQGGKILSIHSVRAVSKVLKELESHLPKRNCVPVLHWFTGTKSEAARAVELGCYFSVNVEMIANEKTHALLRSIPMERLLTETDGPFVSFLDRPVRPTDIPTTVALLAKLRGIDPLVIANQITCNLASMYYLPTTAPPERQLRLFKSNS
ncbi:TatD-related deoxyribonuclease [Rhodanobacter fulvus Jip2]|jgi:TatD DNase family protein|uniref:TatD-related deoxyribonuclease n=1 Tax=Rhodanobacter fulvus Jip2 TaxID=1163408 RepID=I4VSX9_9GAMM|nr:Qat anti-phage system TatD family nuclease QatD [Rhodanobacter fulvus]EIL90320.1 TatD-related deoxyribonuclease [Rhodanobacter fulvus Jip2]